MQCSRPASHFEFPLPTRRVDCRGAQYRPRHVVMQLRNVRVVRLLDPNKPFGFNCGSHPPRSRRYSTANSSRQTFSKRGRSASASFHITWRDAFIIMSQHVAGASHLRPWNLRMAGLQFGAEMTSRLGYDLDTPFHQPSFLPVCFKSIESHVRNNAAYAFDCLDDIGQARNERVIRRQNTSRAAASIRFRNAGCRLARVMMSVGRPRIARVVSFTSISS